MQESELKTSLKQRIFIAVIAALMLGASVAVYVAIILNGGASADSSSSIDQEKIATLQAEYEEKNAKLEELSSEFNEKYYEKLSGYRSKVKSFNAKSANESETVKTEDLKVGSGKEIKSDTENYGAYYIGWCSDETVFDSSFDNFEEPTSLKQPLVVDSESLIEGWYLGVSGMKLGGARIVTIPGKLAYGDSQNPCDPESEEMNVPLKFLIMPFEVTDEYAEVSKEANTAQMKLLYAQYGLEYTE